MNSALNPKPGFCPVAQSLFHVQNFQVFQKFFFYSLYWCVNYLQTKFQLNPSWFGLIFKRFVKTTFSDFKISGPAISRFSSSFETLISGVPDIIFQFCKNFQILEFVSYRIKQILGNLDLVCFVKQSVYEELSEVYFALFRGRLGNFILLVIFGLFSLVSAF